MVSRVHFSADLLLLFDSSSGSGSPTIEGIFGKDWCMNLWKDRDPCTVERDSPQSSEVVRRRFTQLLNV